MMKGRGVLWPAVVGWLLALSLFPITWTWRQVRDRMRVRWR
jgi:hypothetical protein